MTTTPTRRNEIKRRQSTSARVRNAALKAGPVKLLLLSLVLSIGSGLLVHYYFLAPQNEVNDALSTQLDKKRRQNAIARTVQETKPRFLQEFRRVIDNYATARELLPTEAEVSNPAAANAPPPPADAPPQSQITLNERVIPAQIQGPHASVVRFLAAISKYPRIIYVREFSITSLNKEETVNLTLVTYDAPTSGILPPVPEDLRYEYESQGGNTAGLVSNNPR
jgi:hypothetical protein